MKWHGKEVYTDNNGFVRYEHNNKIAYDHPDNAYPFACMMQDINSFTRPPRRPVYYAPGIDYEALILARDRETEYDF